MLVVATGFVAFESEILVGSLEPALESLGLSKFFVGLIIVPIIGNAAEHASAVTFALRNQVDMTLEIAIGSSTQIALFVAPLLVFVSLLVGHPMDFIFSTFEVAAVGMATLIVALISSDGKSNWLEGLQLTGAYVIMAISFFFVRYARLDVGRVRDDRRASSSCCSSPSSARSSSGRSTSRPSFARLGQDYHFPQVRIDATVHQDGSMSVVERRTFDFSGSFSFAYFTLQHRLRRRRHRLLDPRREQREYPAARPRRAGVLDSNYSTDRGHALEFKATWYFDAQDEVRTFTIPLHPGCAVRAARDRAYLNWQAIGTGWEKMTRPRDVTLHLPGARAGHAPVRARPTVRCAPGSEPLAGAARRPCRSSRARCRRSRTVRCRGRTACRTPSTVVGWRSATSQPVRVLRAGRAVPGRVRARILGPNASPVVGPEAPATVTTAEEVLAIERRLADEANAAAVAERLCSTSSGRSWAWSLVPVLIGT